MKLEEKTSYSKKTSNNNENKQNTDYQLEFHSQKKQIKQKLMDKYNISENEAEKILIKIENQKKKEKRKNSTSIKSEETPIPQKKDVDSIIDELIEDYNKNISVELEHVNLTFDIEIDKIDTIKEKFIRTIKRNKNKNIKLHVLKDISFKIYQGEKIGIIGYNGAGKSTLLTLITGIYKPDTGIIKTHGNISPLLSLGAGFDLNYSGRKNILLNGAVLGYDKKFLESKMDEIIEFSELEDFIDIPLKNYSTGMLAKLGFSIATIVEPDILIIDEILGVGDMNFQKKSNDKMRSLMDGKTTVLLVSHSIAQIRLLCDKALWIDHGEIREFGEVNKVCDDYIKNSEKASKEQLKNIILK